MAIASRKANPRRKRIFLGVLAIGAVAVYLPLVFSGGKRNEPAATADELPIGEGGAATAGPKSSSPADSHPASPEGTVKKAPGSLLEPLFGRDEGAEADDEPQLTSVFRAGRDWMAVLDGRIVHVGDRVRGRRVTGIGETGVILSGAEGGKTIHLAAVQGGEHRKTKVPDDPEEPPK
jgi:hypothetical protein